MAEDALTIQYASSRREIWQAYWYMWWHGWQLKVMHAIIVSSVAWAVLSSRGGDHALGAPEVLIALLFGLLAAAWLPFWPLIRFKKATRTLRVDRTGFTTTIGRLSGTRTWLQMTSVRKVPSGNILFVSRSGNMMIIPARAFATSDEADHYFERAREWHATAVERGRRS